MRNFLRAKISISLLSTFILVLIPLLRSNFNAPVTIKRWGKLTWDDFQGFVKPFTGYGAAISSDIYLEYDSTASRFSAYAGQNNVASWTKETGDSDEYGLNHEQYHFNITEIHARILNEFIEANPGESENFYRIRLQTIWYDLRKMQKAYDDETDHCLRRDRQRRWEYKIDSLLNLHAKDSGWVTDYYSGAKTFFPDKPGFRSNVVENNAVVRSFVLSKYDMVLSLESYQYDIIDPSVLENNIRQFYTDRSATIQRFSTDYSQYPFKATVLSKDSAYNYHNLWLSNHDYLFKLSAIYPNLNGDTGGYIEIANAFINSFSIENTDAYWLTRLKNYPPHIVQSPIIKKANKHNNSSLICNIFSEIRPYGFFRGPFYSENGGLLIAYDIVEHPDSLIFENLLVLDEDLYSSKPAADNLYFLPAHKIPKDIYGINFGYTLTEDSARQCNKFYNQRLEINPAKKPSIATFKASAAMQ
jgi:hypothetical protein